MVWVLSVFDSASWAMALEGCRPLGIWGRRLWRTQCRSRPAASSLLDFGWRIQAGSPCPPSPPPPILPPHPPSELRSYEEVEVAVMGSQSLISLMVSVDVKQHWHRAVSEHRSCVEVEVAVLGSPSLISLVVSVHVKQHWNEKQKREPQPRTPVRSDAYARARAHTHTRHHNECVRKACEANTFFAERVGGSGRAWGEFVKVRKWWGTSRRPDLEFPQDQAQCWSRSVLPSVSRPPPCSASAPSVVLDAWLWWTRLSGLLPSRRSNV